MHAAEHSGHPTKAVVMLQLSEDEVWRRFDAAHEIHDRDGRADDNREALKVRLEQFRAETQPVINYYKNRNLLIEVDGAQSREAVTEAIIDALYTRALAVA